MDEAEGLGFKMLITLFLPAVGLMWGGDTAFSQNHPFLMIAGAFALALIPWLYNIFKLALIPLARRLTRPLVAALRRRRSSAPKRNRTWGREWLMLWDKDARKRCWEENRKLIAPTLAVLIEDMFLALILLFIVKTNHEIWFYRGTLITCNLGLMALLLLAALRSRNQVLLPVYHRRAQAEAQVAFDSATADLNAALPTQNYRAVDVPDALPDSLLRLRELADEHRLPDGLEPKLVRVEAAHAKLEVAEQALAEAQAEANRRAAKAT